MIAVRLSLVLVLSAVVAPLNSVVGARNSTPQDFNVGAGTQSCGVWVETRKNPNDLRGLVLESWLQGYIVGVSMGVSVGARSKTAMDFAPPDPEAMAVWTDKYCRENPLDRVIAAAGKLVTELRRK